MTATVTPWPLVPPAMAADIPYAPCSCAPAYPHGANAEGLAESGVPSGVGVFCTVFSPQYCEHGGALTNASGGGADGCSGCTRAAESSRPTTPATAGRPAGTDSVRCGERSVMPL